MQYIISLILIAFFAHIVYIGLNRARIIGNIGGKKVSAILALLSKDYHVFNDILIKNNYGTSQIDHLVVSRYGIFVIETKNYKGWIFGGVKSIYLNYRLFLKLNFEGKRRRFG